MVEDKNKIDNEDKVVIIDGKLVNFHEQNKELNEKKKAEIYRDIYIYKDDFK